MTLTTMLRIIFLPLLVASILTSNCNASPGPYVRADLGRSTIDDDVSLELLTFRLDEAASSWRIAAGWSFSNYLAVEAGWSDIGSVSTSIAGQRVNASADELDLSVIGRLPIGDIVALTGRLGYGWWDARTAVAGLREIDSGSDLVLGAGVEFAFAENLIIGLGYSHLSLDELDVGFAGLSMRLEF